MAEAKGADVWFWVPWLVTAIGIGANLLWNYHNSKVAKRQRTATIELEEFRRLRNSVANDLDSLTNERMNLEGLSRTSGLASSKVAPRVRHANVAASEAYLKLQVSLQRFDESQFAAGHDWGSFVEPLWDDFLQTLDGAYN